MNQTAAIESPAIKPHAVIVPGVAGTVEVVQGFYSTSLLVDGKLVSKRGFARFYDLPGVGGTKVKARLHAGFRGSCLTVEGTRYPIGRQMPTGLAVLALVPIVFFFLILGGALGGGVIGTAIIANRRLAASDLPVAQRAALMVGVCIAALVVSLILASVFQGGVAADLRGS